MATFDMRFKWYKIAYQADPCRELEWEIKDLVKGLDQGVYVIMPESDSRGNAITWSPDLDVRPYFCASTEEHAQLAMEAAASQHVPYMAISFHVDMISIHLLLRLDEIPSSQKPATTPSKPKTIVDKNTIAASIQLDFKCIMHALSVLNRRYCTFYSEATETLYNINEKEFSLVNRTFSKLPQKGGSSSLLVKLISDTLSITVSRFPTTRTLELQHSTSTLTPHTLASYYATTLCELSERLCSLSE